MADWVRVRLANGAHKSIPAAAAEAAGLKPLKQPALNRDGTPAPLKPRVPLGGAASATSSTPEANASDTPEEG
jgi:hypothetical protein